MLTYNNGESKQTGESTEQQRREDRSLAATTAQTWETCERFHQAFPVLEPRVAFPLEEG